MVYIGLDIGSTATKTAVLNAEKTSVLWTDAIPTGWDSRQRAQQIRAEMHRHGYDPEDAG